MITEDNLDDATIVESIPYLLAKPRESLITGRGNYTYILPDDYLFEPYKSNKALIQQQFPYLMDETRVLIVVEALETPLDLSEVTVVDLDASFSIFLPCHRNAAAKLIRQLLDQQTVRLFLSASIYARGRVNAALFAYALTVCLLHRKECKNIIPPSLATTHPYFFFNTSIAAKAREELFLASDALRDELKEIDLQFTATYLEEEQRVAYHREDIGLNLHHWHWHLVYPHDTDGYTLTGTALPTTENDVVKKDRRGELFYYMHQQMLARYNFERLSNNMARVRALTDLRAPIPEGYFPKLNDANASKTWPARQPDSCPQNIRREYDKAIISVDRMERWRDRILEAIDYGNVFKIVINEEGKREEVDIHLDKVKGIDILGDIIESSCLSVNRDYYGDLHNNGHALLAYIHDPDGRFLEDVSSMGSNATAARDPIFYPWHAFINELFMAHKNRLPPYTEDELRFESVKMVDANIKINDTTTTNEFQTFWQTDQIDISWGIDFAVQNRPAYVKVTHLQHKPFTYEIQVQNDGTTIKNATVRIFLAPLKDEREKQFLFYHHREYFIELDKFKQTLNPGLNVFERQSSESSVTIPWEQTFKTLNHPDDKNTAKTRSVIPQPGKGDPRAYCGCGWPHHLLIPKGNGEGYDAVFFVMVTDADLDTVDETDDKPSSDTGKCKNAMSYCGRRGKKYPDKRAMGFPFDRPPRALNQPNVKEYKLEHFITDNMFTRNVTIRFTKKELFE